MVRSNCMCAEQRGEPLLGGDACEALGVVARGRVTEEGVPESGDIEFI